MNYPEKFDTNEKKYQFICKAREETRLLGNLVSKWSDAGITQADYNSLPAELKKVYPYAEKLPKEDFDKFFSKFRLMKNEMAEELSTMRARTEENFAALPIEVDLGKITDAKF